MKHSLFEHDLDQNYLFDQKDNKLKSYYIITKTNL